MTRRNLNVQTPGESAPASPASQDDSTQTPGESVADTSAGTDQAAADALAAQDELKLAQQRIQEQDAEIALLRASQTAASGTTTTKPGAPRDYRRMRAEDIDATKLTAPVLSADGWVVPNPPEKKA
ncbi:hypothetical protein ELS24_10485 [Achromobacter spanius]|uniref:hypothetical protein n=1 Tax=Achromobacter spanius TaxID=217203 RepID=UPI000F8FB6D3|nr:hypothetical protein [Achromobacter spanius]AZS78834.1 hypothetical protein ELS24_10485 [Achromobacter spanius]